MDFIENNPRGDLKYYSSEEILTILLTLLSEIRNSHPNLFRESLKTLCEIHGLPEFAALFDLN